MREEITEPQYWRGSSEPRTRGNSSWSSRLQPRQRVDLAAEAVDAALADAEPETLARPDPSDIVASLASQLELLEKQRQQLQRMLEQVQGN